MNAPVYSLKPKMGGLVAGFWLYSDDDILCSAGDSREEADEVVAEFQRHAQALVDIYFKHAPPMLREALQAKEAAK